MQRSRKPSVFISSTIRDFKDLRSALRFWLEEGGFEVWLSEYNDMEKSPGANTFEACFETIRKADFYILLIGGLRGSLYSSDPDVSVTQQEYRVAYNEFAQQERPIPILFVRAQVKGELDGWARRGGLGEPPFEDATFVRDFVAEVTKEQRTTAAVQGIGPYPPANWLHKFHDFRDIIDALKVELRLRVDVPFERLSTSMKLDLEFTLSALVGKHQHKIKREDPFWEVIQQALQAYGRGEDEVNRLIEEGLEFDLPFPHHWYLSSVIKGRPLDASDWSPVQLNRQQTVRLSLYLSGGVAQPDLLWLRALREAVTSGSLLQYDPTTRSFHETDLSTAATELLREAEHYEGMYKWFLSIRSKLILDLATANQLQQPRFDLSWEQALIIWSLYYSQVNLYRHAASLYAHLAGKKESPQPDSLLPTTPLGAAMEEEIERERASRGDIRQWSEIPEFWNL